MFGAILKATHSSFQKGMTFCRSTYVRKVMKLLAFIFAQPSYSDLSVSIVGIQLNINQLNFRFYIEMILKRNEGVALSPRS